MSRTVDDWLNLSAELTHAETGRLAESWRYDLQAARMIMEEQSAEVERLTRERDDNAATIKALLDAAKPDGFPDYATIIAELDSCGYTTVQDHLCDKFGYPEEPQP